MWKTLTPVLTGASLLLALPVLAADIEQVSGTREPHDYFRQTVHVEIRGELQFVDVEYLEEWAPLDPQIPRPMERAVSCFRKAARITVDGKTFELEFGSNTELHALARKLAGKTVLVRGRLEEWTRKVAPQPGPDGLTPAIAFWQVKQQVVIVSSLEAVEGDYLRETVNVVIRGKLDVDVDLGYAYPAVVTLIRANGKTYALDFGKDDVLRQLAKKFDGQTVVLTGALDGTYRSGGMCLPAILPNVKVAILQSGNTDHVFRAKQVEIKGRLTILRVVASPAIYPPRPDLDYEVSYYYITVNGKQYHMQLTSKALKDLAEKFNGRTVVLTGWLEGPEVVVTGLTDAGPYVRRTETVAVRGRLVFPTTLPDSMNYSGLSCMVAVGGQSYWLDFGTNSNLEELAAKLKGQTVVLTGTYGPRPGWVSPVVINVTSLRIATRE